MKNPVKKLIVSLKVVAFLLIVCFLLSFICRIKASSQVFGLNNEKIAEREVVQQKNDSGIIQGGNFITHCNGKGYSLTKRIHRK
ncbi:hypothetical protein [Marinilabilia rubra]|uniref:Uncharacterized protein n=1 Tax=Marinilabilia rubra TaxID=2162893 RepID=A0A2U2B5P9_9BACT|nr:hypothetical protein [Marinilabilia rubra]PWD98400.1 hypothetical protein DDZ16_15850 [Marinilabilia rubra]